MPSSGDENRKSYVLQPGSEPAPWYRLVERLGGGGFGEVWKAETQGGFQVGLKFVRLEEKSGSGIAGKTHSERKGPPPPSPLYCHEPFR